MSNAYFEERPLGSTEADPTARELGEEIVRWIHQHRPRDRHAVIGVFGARGSGKTTILNIIGAELINRDGAAKEKKTRKKTSSGRVVLPREGRVARLFKPEELSPRASVLSALVKHLIEHLGAPSERGALDPIRQALARTALPEDFRRLTHDLATSSQDLERRLVEFHDQLADVEETVHDGIGKILEAARLRARAGQASGDAFPVVILIDDLDLGQRCALDLLEALNRCFSHPGVVTIITADRPQLVVSIRGDLVRRDGLDVEEAGTLAEAMIHKLVPYRWAVPVPQVDARLAFLWEHGDDRARAEDRIERALPRFWADRLKDDLAEATRRVDPAARGAAVEDARALALERLGPLLPSSWRLLKALHNRLRRSSDRKGGTGPLAPMYSEHPEWYPARQSSLGPAAWPAFRSAVFAVELEHSELDIEGTMERDPSDVFDDLRLRASLFVGPDVDDPPSDPDEIERRLAAHDRRRTAYEEALARMPIEIRRMRLGPEHRAAAGRAMDALARLHADLERASRVTPALGWYLAISLDDDAEAGSPTQWAGAPASRKRHLDLRQPGESGRVPREPGRIRAAVAMGQAYLTEQGLEAMKDLQIVAYAPLSVLVWLGWRLYRAPKLIVWNEFRGKFTRFEGADGPLSGLRRTRGDFGGMRLLERRPLAEAATVDDAILVVAAFGSLGDRVFDLFPADTLAGCKYLWCLTLASTGDFEPGMVPGLLEDVVLALERLRNEHGVRAIHLGLMVPAPVALFIGQQLHSLRPIVLWEHDSATGRYLEIGPLAEQESSGDPDNTAVLRDR